MLFRSTLTSQPIPKINETSYPKVIAAQKGKVVLVDFWATWCVPCRKEMPEIAKLEAKLKAKGFVVVPVSDVPAAWMLLDIGPETRERYAQVVRDAKLVIWNGPMGVFAFPAFAQGTLAVANITTSGGAGTGQNGGNAANINLTTAGGTNDLTVNGTLTALGGTGTSAGTGGTVTLVATGAVSDATTGVVKATDATTITGAASAVLSVVTSAGVSLSGSEALTLSDTTSVSAADLITLDGKTTGMVNASAAAAL